MSCSCESPTADVLSSIEGTAFRVRVNAEGNDLRAVASNEKDWGMAWERVIEPIKQATMQGMKRDVWNMDATLAEDSYTFQAAMVLLTSELVGPYVDRIATFLGYPPGLVQAMAARLYEAKIWESDEVRCESWFDPKKGAVAFRLDLMVAEGELVRKWSEEKKQYAYHKVDIREASNFAVWLMQLPVMQVDHSVDSPSQSSFPFATATRATRIPQRVYRSRDCIVGCRVLRPTAWPHYRYSMRLRDQ